MTDQAIGATTAKISGYWRFALIAAVPAIVAVLALGQPWADPITLLSDPFDLSREGPLHPLMGSFSTMGASLFLYAAAVTLFGATLTNDRSAVAFLVSAGLLSSLLAHDDLFAFHEIIAYEVGLHERVAKIAYLAAVLSYIALSWRLILRSSYLVLGASFAFFAASWAFDSPNLLPILQAASGILGLELVGGSAALYLWEDGSKLLGAALWLWFHLTATGFLVRQART